MLWNVAGQDGEMVVAYDTEIEKRDGRKRLVQAKERSEEQGWNRSLHMLAVHRAGRQPGCEVDGLSYGGGSSGTREGRVRFGHVRRKVRFQFPLFRPSRSFKANSFSLISSS